MPEPTPGVVVYACDLDRGTRAPCSCEGCGARATLRCCYPLRGRLRGRTCDRLLCDRHAVDQAELERPAPSVHGLAGTTPEQERASLGYVYCPVHARVLGARV